MIDDWELLDLARGGDGNAWRRLFEKHYPSLVRMTSSITGSIETGHDLAQESFVRLLSVRIKDHSGTFKSYLSTIAYRFALKEKSRQYTHSSSDFVNLTDGSPSPLDLAIRDDTDRVIFRVLQLMPAENRDILTLRFIAGHSYEEIARITAVPLGTVKSRIFYAVRTCREMLKERGVFT